jgi:histidyl-tRNA synthetase
MELKIEEQSRGVRILVGDEVRERRRLLNALIGIAEANGFNEIMLPSLEPANIYVNKAGTEVLSQMYVFPDKKAGRCACAPKRRLRYSCSPTNTSSKRKI